MDRTLYVTDLDGTLMRNDKSVSDYTVNTINRLIDCGLHFTYATARTISSSSEITSRIKINIPVITRNGTVLADQKTKELIEVAKFKKDATEKLRKLLSGDKICGFVTSIQDNQEFKTYLADLEYNAGFQNYLDEHKEDKRLRAVHDYDELFNGDVCYITIIGDKEKLDTVYDKVKLSDEWVSVYQKDVYRPEYWLEICPKKATKAYAIKRICELCDCNRIVVFGDSLNDISMFEAADEAYAVENAMRELKDIATEIISGNEEDGVARWLEKKYANHITK